MTGIILQGINNIFTVQSGEFIRLCRIKGKVLQDSENVYNPLAPGDIVHCEGDLITERLPRKNCLVRWNRKRNNMQAIAANVDQLILIGCVSEPPLRPRFLDRGAAIAELSGIPCIIAINKTDLGINSQDEERLEAFRKLGYEIILTSTKNNTGLSELKKLCLNKRTVFYGQSGVGKSSCINAMFPGLALKTGDISAKHNRGKHTTNFGRLLTSIDLLEPDSGIEIIDTPGIRELHVMGYSIPEIAAGYIEIAEAGRECAYNSCTHRHEPGCAVKEAVKSGLIHSDRYTSYLNCIQDMQELTKQFSTPELE